MTTKDKVIDYVMNTPYNSNRAVLESLINSAEDDDKITYPKVFMKVTPGMSFDIECLTHSYEDFMAFEDNTIVWLDEE